MARVDMPAWATKTAQEAMQADVTQIKTDVAALVAKYSQIVVTCETQDDTTVTGQTVTLRAGTSADAPVYDTRAYNGQPVTFEVPRGFRYFVEVSATLPGHYAPTTATGTATTGTVAVVLTYSDIDHITTFPALESAVRSMSSQAEGRAALVGIEIADTWTDEGGDVLDDPKIVADVQPVLDPEGVEHLAVILMAKYCGMHDIPFDAPESGVAAYATEETAIGGHYYWGYGATYTQKTYAANAWCSYNGGIFQCTTAVTSAESFDPAKWSMKDAIFYLDTKTYAVGDYAKINGHAYQCITAVETPEPFDETKWTQVLATSSFQSGALVYVARNAGQAIDYTAYGTFYHTDVSSSTKDYFANGYNNWELSAQRQYMNSAAAIGEWWNPQHIGDCPPNNLNSVRGYKAGCSAALLAAAKPIRVPVWPWNLAPQYTIDTFWLPSGKEMFGEVNDDEGYPFKLIEDNCKEAQPTWTSANNGSNSARVFRRVSAKGSAAACRLRSADRSGSNYVWIVGAGGAVHNGNAGGAYACIPACAIY